MAPFQDAQTCARLRQSRHHEAHTSDATLHTLHTPFENVARPSASPQSAPPSSLSPAAAAGSADPSTMMSTFESSSSESWAYPHHENVNARPRHTTETAGQTRQHKPQWLARTTSGSGAGAPDPSPIPSYMLPRPSSARHTTKSHQATAWSAPRAAHRRTAPARVVVPGGGGGGMLFAGGGGAGAPPSGGGGAPPSVPDGGGGGGGGTPSPACEACKRAKMAAGRQHHAYGLHAKPVVIPTPAACAARARQPVRCTVVVG